MTDAATITTPLDRAVHNAARAGTIADELATNIQPICSAVTHLATVAQAAVKASLIVLFDESSAPQQQHVARDAADDALAAMRDALRAITHLMEDATEGVRDLEQNILLLEVNKAATA